MLVPPIPANELQRIAALRSLMILDTPREERFDRITRLATVLFHVPISLISLIEEERQWFKSCQGLEATETPRWISFCAHTILHDEILIVPDARLDERFAHNPLVLGKPFIRFYAGCPIHDIDGNRLGTFCIIDQVPRHMSEAEQQALKDMGIWVDHEINATRLSQAFIAQHESEARLRACMESTSEAMLLVSPDHHLLTANQRFSEFFGIPIEKVIGQGGNSIAPLLERTFANPEHVRSLTVDMVSDTQQHYTTFIQQRWPQARELELFSTPVYSGSQHIGRLFTFRDVTHERELDRMKTEFVSQVSHELRSPLTAIKGYIDLFVEGHTGPLSPTQQHLLTIVQSNTDQLISLINDLLDLSRIEAGHFELRRSMVDIQPIIQNVMELLQPQFAFKQQTLTLQQQKPLPPTLADAGRIAQVLTNILSNAHKYTPVGGKITITTHSDEHYIVIDIEDNGIGLAREEQAHIFTKFYRSQHGLNEASNGAGLGLAISRSIVEAHHGKIAVTSTVGQGSTFSILLPTPAELRKLLITQGQTNGTETQRTCLTL
jgi:PAS domain S-box-containing protein